MKIKKKVSIRNELRREDTKIAKLENKLKKVSLGISRSPKQNVKSSFHLSECAQKFLIAQAKPFDPMANGACVPHEPAPNSQKATLNTKFTLTIGGTNKSSCAAIYFAPTLASDIPACYYTSNDNLILTPDTDFTGANLLPMCNAAYFNAPYTYSDLVLSDSRTPSVAGRVVSYGVRITPETADNFNGGVMYWYSDPSHANTTRSSVTTLLSQPQTARYAIGNSMKTKPVIFTLGPTFVEEQQYPTLGGTSSSNDYVFGINPLSRGQTLCSYAGNGENLGNGVAKGVASAAVSGSTLSLSTPFSRAINSGEQIAVVRAGSYLGFINCSSDYSASATSITVSAGSCALSTIASSDVFWVGVPSQLSQPFSTGTSFVTPGGAPAMCLIQPSNASTSNTFLIEIIEHVEYIGTKTSAMQTQSHGDPFALSKIMSSMSQIPQLVAASPYTPWVRLVAQAVIKGFESYTGVGAVSFIDASRAVLSALRI